MAHWQTEGKDRSKAVLTCICGLFVLFMSCVCHALASVHCYPVFTSREGLTSWPLFLMFIVIGYFPIWYPGTGVVLDCIDS